MPEEQEREPDDEVLGVTSSGTVITEKLAEQWATEFEREDFEITNWELLHVIPIAAAQADVGPGIAFPLSSLELDALKKRAKEEDRPLAVLIREALDS